MLAVGLALLVLVAVLVPPYVVIRLLAASQREHTYRLVAALESQERVHQQGILILRREILTQLLTGQAGVIAAMQAIQTHTSEVAADLAMGSDARAATMQAHLGDAHQTRREMFTELKAVRGSQQAHAVHGPVK